MKTKITEQQEIIEEAGTLTIGIKTDSAEIVSGAPQTIMIYTLRDDAVLPEDVAAAIKIPVSFIPKLIEMLKAVEIYLVAMVCLLALSCHAQSGHLTTAERRALMQTNWQAYLQECAAEVRIKMTNTMPNPSITLRLDVTTNWTGIQRDNQELGYVATNHVAIIYYQGATNEYVLKTTVSELARWRPMNLTITAIQMTNYFVIPNWIPR